MSITIFLKTSESQVYIQGVAYLLPSTSGNVETFIDTVKHTVNREDILRE